MPHAAPLTSLEIGGRYYRYDSRGTWDVNAEGAMKMRRIDEHFPSGNPAILADRKAPFPGLRER
jgi:hypothetical protein